MSKFGRCQGYTGKPCSNCGRYRVEHFEEPYVAPNEPNFGNGYDICEKCSWCEQLGRYVTDDEFYDDIDYEKFWQYMRGEKE